MPLYQSKYLVNLSRSNPGNLTESTKSFSANDTYFDIFLSHSFLDMEEVRGLYLDLKKLGYKVYVDWIVDPHLDRNNVTKETAEHIRNRLNHSKTLFLAISESATISKWIPWELGFVDGNTGKCAIVPVSREEYPAKVFRGREFLALYPIVKNLRNTSGIDTLWIIENANRYATYNEWAKKNIMPYYQTVNIDNL